MSNDVTGDHLPNSSPQRSLEDLSADDFLPGDEDIHQLRAAAVPLWARTLVKSLPAFKPLQRAAIWHIPHMYEEEMSNETVVVSTLSLRLLEIYIFY